MEAAADDDSYGYGEYDEYSYRYEDEYSYPEQKYGNAGAFDTARSGEGESEADDTVLGVVTSWARRAFGPLGDVLGSLARQIPGQYPATTVDAGFVGQTPDTIIISRQPF